MIWDPFFALAQTDPDARTLTDAQAAPSHAFLLARRAFATTQPQRVRTIVDAVNAAAAWAGSHQDELATTMAAVTGVDVAAQRVAAARGSYHFDPMTASVAADQQRLADTFAELRIIPGDIDVSAALLPAASP